ncbi:MAG: Ig-like domain-containing protein [Anaerolineales bacterium]|nr:Ig-like domain-containing protein [Anaerolineales bacterium]
MNKRLGIWIAVGILAIVVGAVAVKSISDSTPEITAEKIGPQVVGQFPAEGQWLDLNAPIKITFDREMNPQSADAFTVLDSDEESVAGKISWENPQTLVFTPKKNWTPSSQYQALISTGLEDVHGETLQEDVRIRLLTIDKLGVTDIFPVNGAETVDTTSSITVVFNHPMIPLTVSSQQGKLPQPLTITPEVQGKGEWVSSSVYIFEPEKSLKSGTRYQVRVAAGLKDVSGNAMEESYQAEFVTQNPVVEMAQFVNGPWMDFEGSLDHIRLDQPLVVRFSANVAMNQQSVEAATRVTDRETEKSIPLKFEWNEAGNTMTVTPVGKYSIQSFYVFSIDKSAQAEDGGQLGVTWTAYFSTVPYPAVKGIYPNADEKDLHYTPRLTINFASEMDVASLKNRIQITPPLKDDLQLFSHFYLDSNSVSIYGLEPSTDYVVRILPGAKDVYGNAIKEEYAFTFKNPAYDPYSRLKLPNYPLTFQFDGLQDIYYERLNVEQEQIAVYPLKLEEVGYLFGDSPEVANFKPDAPPVQEWNFEFNLNEDRDQLKVEQLLLKDRQGNPLKPGFYYILRRQDGNDDVLQGQIFSVATDNLVLKSSASEGLAWITNLKSGEPRSNVPVAFYDAHFNEVGRGRTDLDGKLLLADLKSQPYYALAKDGGHFGFTSLAWGDGARPGSFGISSGYYAAPQKLFAYLYTDRAIYRPGQLVYFKGILRKDDDLHYAIPEDDPVYVVCQYGDEVIYEKYVSLSSLGSFTDTLTLSSDAAVGTYTIRALAKKGDDNAINSVSFRVAEYEKPEFEVTTAANQADILIGDTATFNVDALYYSGGVVSNATVNWFIELNSFTFTPAQGYSGYSFRDWERDRYFYDSQLPMREALRGETVNMDATGHVEISQEFLPADVSVSQRATLGVNVTDVTGNVVSGSANVIIHQSEYYAGIRAASYVAVQGEAQSFDVAVLDWDSNPIPNQQVTVKFVQRQWYSVQEKDAQGNLTWKTTVKEIPAGQKNAVTDEEGRATVAFTPSQGGVYKALVIVKDSKGRSHQASTYIWVAGAGYVPWRQTNDHSFSLIADRELYAPGDTARLLIAQPFEGEVYALVTYERGHIYKSEVLKLTGNSTIYELPITDELAPIAYVSVTVISGAEDSGVPNYKVGMTTINIDTAQKRLNVQVTADKKTAGPGDEITYSIQVADFAGKPVVADVSLAVIDKAVLALTAPNSSSLLSSFYSPRALSILTANGLITSADAYNHDFREALNDGQSAGGGGGDSEGVVTVREDFKDTAVFRAQVTTDENGTAQVTFKLPENLTTWVADVRAVTEDSLVGEGSAEMQTNKPLYVQIQTPRFFVAGDEAEIGAAVHNNTKQDLTVEVSIEATGLEFSSATTQRVAVPAGQQVYVAWVGKVAPTAERVDLIASVTGGGLTDASKPALGTLPNQGIPVLHYTVNETVGTAGMLTERGSVTEAVRLPDPSMYTQAFVEVQLAPSLVASIQPSLTYLEDFPYLCMEQTVSRVLPNVITKRILSEAGVKNGLSANLDEQVNLALQRIYATQLYDNGWSWWNAPESDPYVSAYILYGLLEAQKSGYPVSDVVLKNGLQYLKQNLPYPDDSTGAWELNRQAFLLYVLAVGDELPSGSAHLNYLYVYNDRLSLYGKAYLAQTLHLLDPEDGRILALLSDLQAGATLSASGAHWEEDFQDYRNWNSDIRTTAIVLNAYVQIEPENPITANAVRWLMANRQGDHWSSTQDTAWTLIALVNWLSQQGDFDAQYNFAVGLNGEALTEGAADPQNLNQTTELQIELEQMLKDEANFLVVSRGAGAGNLYYTAFLKATMNVPDVEPIEKGIFIKREYFSLEDAETPITSAEMGDLVQARLTIVAPSALYYVAVDDPLPAGFEAVDSTLQTDTIVPSTITIAGLKERGWGWWFFDHIQIQDEKISLSADYLPAGTYVYTYLARASNRGIFNVMPPAAFEFYFPDVSGHGAGSTFIIK